MARVKRGVTSRAKHKKVLKAVKGQWGRRKNTIRVARQAMEKAMQYAYRDRRNKKRDFKSLWIQRINAGVRQEGMTYAKFINDVENNLEEQKTQLFKLKLANAETNVATMLANADENATSNDFIAIEREIKKYTDVVFSLKTESDESSEKRSLWNSHHNKINIFHNRLQKNMIQLFHRKIFFCHMN